MSFAFICFASQSLISQFQGRLPQFDESEYQECNGTIEGI